MLFRSSELEAYELSLLDTRAELDTAKEEGIKEGMVKGKEEGIKEGKIETAKRMKAIGMSIVEISNFTGLSKEENDQV